MTRDVQNILHFVQTFLCTKKKSPNTCTEDYCNMQVSSNLCLLRRLARYLPRRALVTFYFAKIASYFNYCSLVWSSCSSTNAKRLQLAQNYAARIILRRCKFSSASEARSQLGWPSLEEVRSIYLRRLLSSIQENSATPYLCSMVKPISSYHNHRTRSSVKGCLHLSQPKSNFGKSAISYRLCKLSHV